jgi:hypothetical protein
MCEDGTPLELVRGAMGVTYKAFDLRYLVTLEVIIAKYFGERGGLRARERLARVQTERISNSSRFGVDSQVQPSSDVLVYLHVF